MKSRKIFFAIAALAIILCVVGCSETPIAPSGSEVPTCFQFEAAADYTNISTLKGEPIASNSENNLVALKTYRVDSTQGIRTVITVYNLLTGKVVYEPSHVYFNDPNVISIDVNLDNYPLVAITLTKRVEDSELGMTTKVEHYYDVVKAEYGYTSLGNNTEDVLRAADVGNMKLFGVGNTLYWVNKAGVIVREQPIFISDSYDDVADLPEYFDYFAEFKGYVYALEFSESTRMMQVYDPDGICVVQFNFPDNAVAIQDGTDYDENIINPRAFVLNDGNVLIQYCEKVEDIEAPCDFFYQSTRLDLKSVIVDHTNGDVKEIELNEVVLELESKYSRTDSDAFAFELSKNFENQAYTVPFANGTLNKKVEYKVFDNEMAEKYVFVNDILGYQGVYDINPESVSKNGYVAAYAKNGMYVYSYFDYDGNVKATLGENIVSVYDDFMCSEYGVYTLDGKIAYDFESNGFVPEFNKGLDEVAFVIENKIFLNKFNPETGKTEVYALNSNGWTELLVANGDNVEFADGGEGYFMVYDSDTDVATLYNSSNDIILKVRGEMHLYELEDIVYVTVTVGGEDLVYVINSAK